MRRHAEVTPLTAAEPRQAHTGPTDGGFLRFLRLVDAWLLAPRRRARRRRIELDALAGLSRHVLADVGLQPIEVRAVTWGGVPSAQLGRRMQPAGAVVVCCAAWPKPCTCVPCRPEPARPQALPEAA